ncbi:MAG: APC family permease [Candidatus Sericytochromatia bacterium]
MSETPVSALADASIDEDIATLHKMGYGQELLRRMSGFSNYAISMSIICILAGCVTSFHIAFSSVGGAAIGLGWLFSCLISLCFALNMGQLASAHPTAGGIYHWASILGGKGWGWATAWINLIGMITVLAAINVGTYLFALSSFGSLLGLSAMGAQQALLMQFGVVTLITLSQALLNHKGIRLTTMLTDFSGWWILIVSALLTIAMFFFAPTHDFSRLWTFTNYSGAAGGNVWPANSSLSWLFLLGLLLPIYTVTGFDASANTSEETIGAARTVPKAIVQAVVISGVAGWIMLCSFVMAAPDMNQAAAQGASALTWIMGKVLPAPLPLVFYAAIVIAQYLCGLATLTSASRMVYAFARDGGLPFSGRLKQVSASHRTPSAAIWTVAVLSILFTAYTPVYVTMTVICSLFLYISYMLPAALGFIKYGRSWTEMGPWTLGRFYRPIAAICVLGCGLFFVIGIQPPNDKALTVTLIIGALMLVCWFGYIRKVFHGPPLGKEVEARLEEIEEVERKVGQTGDLKPITGKLGTHPSEPAV